VRDRLAGDRLFHLSADLPRVVELDVAAIAPNPEQPRAHLDPEALEGLKSSIERHGLLQPILVQRREGHGYVLVAGQRRLAAVAALGRATIAAILASGDPGEVALVENLQRQDLDPFEEAKGIARLMERHGYSQGEAGLVLGKKQNTVSALLALNRLPEAIREDYARTPGVGRSLLIEIAQVQDPAQQRALWARVKAGASTVRDLRAERRVAKAVTRSQAGPAAGLRRFVGAGEKLVRELHAAPVALDGELRDRLQALHASLGEILAASDTP
jgi:ParB family chromosome partitioning protein